MTVFIVRDSRGMYYGGDVYQGRHIALVMERENAMQMEDWEVKEDFPDGLPAGWELIQI